ncbi:MAG: sulfatase-like hydrolase/transferase, partial [Pseudomonadota bacterium]
ERTGVSATDFADFVTLWLLRPVPNPLTEEALPPAREVGEWLLAHHNSVSGIEPSPSERPKPLTYRRGIEVVSSKYAIEKAVADEALRHDGGEYVYMHAVMPHIPYVFDQTCTYRDPYPRDGDEAGRRQAYLDQSVCSVRLLEGFLNRLRALKRYDSATILIHADTGAKEGFFGDPPGFQSTSTTLGLPDNELLSGINALLMIKRPNQADPLQESNQLTQLADLFPTLLDILSLEDVLDTPIHSRSIYADGTEHRQVRFGYDPHPSKPRGANVIEVRIETPEDLKNSPLTVVGPALDPANWRDEIQHAK